MDLSGADGISIATGLALVPEINVLAYDPTLTRLYGQFRIFTTGGENNTETSLGDTARLWWFSPGEWEALEEVQRVDPIFPFDVREMYSTVAPS
jgi:hypothetical protein